MAELSTASALAASVVLTASEEVARPLLGTAGPSLVATPPDMGRLGWVTAADIGTASDALAAVLVTQLRDLDQLLVVASTDDRPDVLTAVLNTGTGSKAAAVASDRLGLNGPAPEPTAAVVAPNTRVDVEWLRWLVSSWPHRVNHPSKYTLDAQSPAWALTVELASDPVTPNAARRWLIRLLIESKPAFAELPAIATAAVAAFDKLPAAMLKTFVAGIGASPDAYDAATLDAVVDQVAAAPAAIEGSSALLRSAPASAPSLTRLAVSLIRNGNDPMWGVNTFLKGAAPTQPTLETITAVIEAMDEAEENPSQNADALCAAVGNLASHGPIPAAVLVDACRIAASGVSTDAARKLLLDSAVMAATGDPADTAVRLACTLGGLGSATRPKRADGLAAELCAPEPWFAASGCAVPATKLAQVAASGVHPRVLAAVLLRALGPENQVDAVKAVVRSVLEDPPSTFDTGTDRLCRLLLSSWPLPPEQVAAVLDVAADDSLTMEYLSDGLKANPADPAVSELVTVVQAVSAVLHHPGTTSAAVTRILRKNFASGAKLNSGLIAKVLVDHRVDDDVIVAAILADTANLAPKWICGQLGPNRPTLPLAVAVDNVTMGQLPAMLLDNVEGLPDEDVLLWQLPGCVHAWGNAASVTGGAGNTATFARITAWLTERLAGLEPGVTWPLTVQLAAGFAGSFCDLTNAVRAALE